MAKRLKKIEPVVTIPVITPKIEFYFYIGDKYYRRMQPIPYKYKNDYIKNIKEILNESYKR